MVRGAWGALGIYGVVSLLYFGLPALSQPGTPLISANEIEPSAFQWFLAWWPEAVGRGQNPFVTDLIYAPDTVNMTWVTAIPGLSLALSPVTLLFGPVASYNVLTLAAPVLAGLAAFALCRHLTQRFWPSLAGGYFFGFSPFMLIALAGIPSHYFTALLPLAAYLVVRRIDGSLGKRGFVALLAAVLAGQFLVSIEVFAMLTVFGTLVVCLAYYLLRDRRTAIREAAPAVLLAYVVAVVALSPYLYYVLFEPRLDPVHAVPLKHSSDLLSFAVPTSLQQLGAGLSPSLEQRFGGAIPVAGGGGGYAYLGLPLLVIVALFGVSGWRDPRRQLLLLSAGLVGVASLGPRLFVAGRDLVPMPERILAELPLLQYALPSRFPVYTALVVAVIVAVWLATRPAAWKWALAVAALVFVLPNLGSGNWSTSVSSPPFFTEEGYKQVLSEDDIVFTVPVLGAPVRWHAEAGMPFRLANGYIGRIPDDLTAFYADINAPGPLPEAATRAFLERRRISVLLVAAPPGEYGRWRQRLAFLGARPEEHGGVLVFRLSPPRG